LELSEDSYGWGLGTISSNQKCPTRFKESLKKKYYVVGVIGSGITSKVFHTVDLDCKEYAIKMYVKRFDGNTYLTEEEFEENGRKSVTTEVKNFKLIYPNLNVVCQKLNNHHCVIMPFFNPVPKDKRDGFIDNIENVLEVFASKKRKYKDEMFVGGMWDFTKETAFSVILQSSRHQRANVLSHCTWRNSRAERT
jgi:hypothetical protein